MTRSVIPVPEQWRLWRYLNTAHIAAYVGLSSGDVYKVDNFFDPLVNKYQLLNEDERNRLQMVGVEVGAGASRECLTWAIDSLYRLRKNGVINVDDCYEVVRLILSMRGNIATLFHFNDEPVPFPYIHFVYLMQFIYLPLLAYSCAMGFPYTQHELTSQELFGPLVLFLCDLYFMGLTGTKLCCNYFIQFE